MDDYSGVPTKFVVYRPSADGCVDEIPRHDPRVQLISPPTTISFTSLASHLKLSFMMARELTSQEQKQAKEIVAAAVVEEIRQYWETNCRLSQRELLLGLGTGSTVEPALSRLSSLIANSQLANVAGMPTSQRTGAIARRAGIRVIDPNENVTLDIGFDGADFIAGRTLRESGVANVIKGGGAAHVVERQVAEKCNRWIIIADASKEVDSLDARHWIPIEVPTAQVEAVLNQLQSLGAVEAVLREGTPGRGRKPTADNGHPIIEAHFEAVTDEVKKKLDSLEPTFGAKHGLFFGMADEVILSGPTGPAEVIQCRRSR